MLKNLEWLKGGASNIPIIVSETEPEGEFGKGGGLWIRPLPDKITEDLGLKYPLYGVYVYTGGNSLVKPETNLPEVAMGASFVLILMIMSSYSEEDVVTILQAIGGATKFAFIGFFDPLNTIRKYVTLEKEHLLEGKQVGTPWIR